jgi:hypothetical protein
LSRSAMSISRRATSAELSACTNSSCREINSKHKTQTYTL